MELDRLNRWLTLVANLGVAIGIIFLAIEIGQNERSLEEANRINRVMARVDDVETFNDWRGQWVQDEELSRIYIEGRDGNELSDLDQERFLNLCTSELWMHLKLFERARALNDEVAASNAIVLLAKFKLPRRPGIRECWDVEKHAMIAYGSTEFVARVEEGLK
jgi:hypothetical protein